MIPCMALQVLTDDEIARIHVAALTILSRTGMAVENDELCAILAEHGGEVDRDTQRVRFPEALVERFIDESDKIDPSEIRPSIDGQAGIYQGPYLEPKTNKMLPFTDELLAGYVKLAHVLDGVTGIHMQNYPVAAARPTEPLELRIFAWKYGAHDVGSIQRTELCPYLIEMYEIRAETEGKSLAEVYRGEAFMISPLRLPAHEADQVMFFHSRGLRVNLGSMITLGGTGPVTLAGSVALNLAEQLAKGFIARALYGGRQWGLGLSIAPLDMRTTMQPYGRPEMLLANLATMQLARHYRVGGGVHSGLTDAKLPSNEASAQKLLTALPCALAGWGNIEPGLLSIDEVFSPIQMVIDAETVRAVRHVIRGFDVNDETLAVDLIDEIGPGGFFTASEHTAAHFRQEQWQPLVWSREMLQHWLAGERRLDVDNAYDVWQDAMAQPDPDPGITPETEARLQEIVRRAAARL